MKGLTKLNLIMHGEWVLNGLLSSILNLLMRENNKCSLNDGQGLGNDDNINSISVTASVRWFPLTHNPRQRQ